MQDSFDEAIENNKRDYLETPPGDLKDGLIPSVQRGKTDKPSWKRHLARLVPQRLRKQTRNDITNLIQVRAQLTDVNEPDNVQLPPVEIDSAEAYNPIVNIDTPRLKDGNDLLEKSAEFIEDQRKTLEYEEKLLGISLDSHPDQFVAAHNALLSDMQTEMNEQLPDIKQLVIEKTAAYFAGGDETAHKLLAQLLEQRLAATKQVGIGDVLVDSVNLFRRATFDRDARQPIISSGALFYLWKNVQKEGDFHEAAVKVLLAHEIIHGMLTGGLMNRFVIRNGLMVVQPDVDLFDKHGLWLNEATIESFRQTIMETQEVGYEPGVMVLHMLDELSPGLRDRLMLAALDRVGPGPVFAEVEELLGPTGIEEMQELIGNDMRNEGKDEDFEDFKNKVVLMLPQELQERGRNILEE